MHVFFFHFSVSLFTLQDLDTPTGPDILPAWYLSGVSDASASLLDHVFERFTHGD